MKRAPRCSRLRCDRRAEIAGWCIQHAEKEADERFSRWVRARDGACTFPRIGDCRGILQAAHGVGRGNHRTRFDPENVHALCERHHKMVDQHGREGLKRQWLTAALGVQGYDQLMDRSLEPRDRREAVEAALDALQVVEPAGESIIGRKA